MKRTISISRGKREDGSCSSLETIKPPPKSVKKKANTERMWRVFQAPSVTTWDFSTLYTSIPHEKLKHRIHELLEKTYAVRRKSFIATDNFRTFWTNEKKCNRYHFSCRDLCRAIDFLIDNIFVRFRGKIFRQVIGIPMGTNSARLLADLFLHTYEYEFIIKTMKGDITRALQFNKTF